MICKSYQSLPAIRKKYKKQKIVFCSGCFDLVHAGHILFFEHCKTFGDILVVGIGSDLMLRRNKGDKRPIMNEHVRLKMVDSLKSVDYTFLDESTHDDHPLQLVEEVFKTLKPDVYVFNKDGFQISYRKDLAHKYGVATEIIGKHMPIGFKDISTTSIVDKIQKQS